MAESVVTLLNAVLSVEYTIITHYPKLVSMVRAEETKKLVNALGVASVKHADAVAKAITRFQGSPVWALEPFPLDDGLQKIFERQLEKEQMAREMHHHIATLMPDNELRNQFEAISKEEESHMHVVREILKRLAVEDNSPQGGVKFY